MEVPVKQYFFNLTMTKAGKTVNREVAVLTMAELSTLIVRFHGMGYRNIQETFIRKDGGRHE
jgi:hypothetical protein